ncbi:restriction endonuclease subunit S [Vibrio metoecus]|uniref:restriction endonuclease subunit S n=1 Tax=Vibrio metoecus TaxID=1481663 RepID=UPI0006D848CE|nr:restriction endonuclease subunit S [Vibrio metoecus]
MEVKTQKQVAPEGYKISEIGIIPIDWDVKRLSEVSHQITDGTHHTPKYVKSGVPFYSVENITANNFEDTKYISQLEHDALIRRCKPERGNIIMSRITAGLLGDTKLIDWDVDASIYVSLALLKLKNEVSPEYIYCYTKCNQFLSDVSRSGLVNATPKKINLNAIGQVPVPVPPTLIEQTAIANALSDVDALISELEKLIAKKQAIKTATMQQLLTGNKRFPEFANNKDGTPKGYKKSELGEIPEDWKLITVLDLTRNIIDYRGRTPKKLGMEWGGGSIVALSAGNVKHGYIDFKAECYLGSDALYKRWMTAGEPEKDDIAFTMEAPLGNVALIPDNNKYILSQRTILLQLERTKYLPGFIFQVFMSDFFSAYLSDNATGSTAQGIKRSAFEKVSVLVPSTVDEQEAISKVLSDMDSDIQLLTKRLTKTRQIKQGMMQELLTGKTRLVKPESK